MKNKGVCKGCKYLITNYSLPDFIGCCDYLEKTGQSRLVIEMANGGFKKDSCICYEEGKRKPTKKRIVY